MDGDGWQEGRELPPSSQDTPGVEVNKQVKKYSGVNKPRTHMCGEQTNKTRGTKDVGRLDEVYLTR